MILPSFSGWSANESVSQTFSRVMKATTSPWGAAADPPLVALATAPFLMGWLWARQSGQSDGLAFVLLILVFLPAALAVGISLSFGGARKKVVDWLSALPFPLENMNAVLNGVGDFVEVYFHDAMPEEKAFNLELDGVHPDAFITRYDRDAKIIEIRIGVVDDKRSPARSNHARYARVLALVDRVLVPTNAAFPIAGLYLK